MVNLINKIFIYQNSNLTIMNIAIIYPNQLFTTKDLPYDITIMDVTIIVEDPIYYADTERSLRFNLLKLIYQRASSKYYEDYLSNKNIRVKYLDWQKNPNMLFKFIRQEYGVNNILHIIDPVDWLLEKRITKYSTKQQIMWYDSPLFLLTNDDLKDYIETQKDKNKYYQYSFYIWHRKNKSILLDSKDKPIGGKYSYDKYNRQQLPSKTTTTASKKYNNKFYDEAILYCEATFTNYYPDNYNPENVKYYPITHKDSKAHYQRFLKQKLQHFGDYEDAIRFSLKFSDMTLFHSVISMQLNIGLITPRYVLDQILEYYKKSRQDILHSVEGFVRQLNWREYCRLLYRYAYDKMVGKNYFNNRNHLTKAWYNGTLGVGPVDVCIKFAFQFGYLHHILRLMVICNFMNLCNIHPDDVYRWFMEFSLDSYDWVMIFNIYSMGMFADNILATTKPYISSSKYVLRMSDAKKDGYWDMLWDILYHYFIYRNYDKFVGRGKIYLSHWNKQRNKADIIDTAKKLLIKMP